MTKVVKKLIKCAKCGHESMQLFVHSVNFSLGKAEDNQKLIHHQQICPKCNYSATNISLTKK